MSRRVAADNGRPVTPAVAAVSAALVGVLVAGVTVLGGHGTKDAPLGGATLVATTSTHSLFGTAGSLTSHGFVIHAGAQVVSVRVNSATSYVEPSAASPSLANVHAGLTVGVLGSQNSRAVVVASEVFVSPKNSARAGAPVSRTGVITQLTGKGFMLATSSGSFWVNLGASTLYFENGANSPTASDLATGLNVARERDS